VSISIFGRKLSVRVTFQKAGKPLEVNLDLQKRLLKSYSQFNEDVLIRQLFSDKQRGTYIDIGANHPINLNNTKMLYDMNWSGVNVEPNPRLYKLICEDRKRDINVNCGVADVAGEMIFYEIEPDCYSTFDENIALMAKYSRNKKVVNKTGIKVVTIQDIFAMCDRHVDLLSIDTEGFDYKVLSTNDWGKNRPGVILVELNHDEDDSVHNLLINNNYALILYNGTNGVFVDESNNKW